MKAKLILDKDFTIGPVDDRLFGGFIEHLGRHIYSGIYEPGHPDADASGFRADVLDLVRELRMPVMRYPGGNFVSGYNWEDGVGPKDRRPVRLDLAWMTKETNEFGTNEFIDWCRKAGTEPVLAVNLGTRGPDEARNLVEYCNHPGGTAWSDLRREHGYAAPHAVKTWCLGNEMDGPWQIGHKTAGEYGRIACEAAKLMKWTDPSIELVVCGSSFRGMPTFGKWELEVLEHTWDHVDYLSLHTYCPKDGDDTAGFLAKPEKMGRFIEEAAAICDTVAALKKSPKKMPLAFDEWNVWYHDWWPDCKAAKGIKDWDEAPPLLEDVYTMEDALCFGGMLITLLNHADRVKMGCLAQVVNVIAPIMTAKGGPAWRQTIFYPFLHASQFGRGTVLRSVIQVPTYDTPSNPGTPWVSLSAVLADDGSVHLFAVNRHLSESVEIHADLRGLGSKWQSGRHITLRHDNLGAANTREQMDAVVPSGKEIGRAGIEQGDFILEPASWNVLSLLPAPK